MRERGYIPEAARERRKLLASDGRAPVMRERMNKKKKKRKNRSEIFILARDLGSQDR